MRGPRLVALALAVSLTGAGAGMGCSRQAFAQPGHAPAAAVAVTGRAAPLSDAVRAKRPRGGEWFGLYLLGKKVGHVYSELHLVPGQPDKVKVVNELVFKANVGQRVSERRLSDTRIYESKPDGRLLSFVVVQTGDGGDQRLEATNTAKGLHVVRKRPGQPDDVRDLPASKETVEAADQARVALLRGKKVRSVSTDGTDLESYELTSEPLESQVRTVGGVKTKLFRVTTLSQKEKVPTVTVFDAAGAIIEVDMGETMRAVAESKDIAQQLDKVEVFGLTRLVLPKALSEARARQIPGALKLVVRGLPESFHNDSFRQKYRALGDGLTEIDIRAIWPDEAKRAKRPLKDPAGGEYLKPTLAVESDAPAIRALSKKLVAQDQDAWTAAKKIVLWVHSHMQRDYGSSSDRATDVLRQMKGDCTEHALLSVALLRAAGIPAKRVDGLVYVMNEDGVPALYWHEWVEAYVGEWTQLDPTFDQVVADATHVQFGEEGSAEITPLIGSLKVEKVE